MEWVYFLGGVSLFAVSAIAYLNLTPEQKVAAAPPMGLFFAGCCFVMAQWFQDKRACEIKTEA